MTELEKSERKEAFEAHIKKALQKSEEKKAVEAQIKQKDKKDPLNEEVPRMAALIEFIGAVSIIVGLLVSFGSNAVIGGSSVISGILFLVCGEHLRQQSRTNYLLKHLIAQKYLG